MKLRSNRILSHVLALLGTGIFWLDVGGIVGFLTKGAIRPSTLIIHAIGTTFIAYSLALFQHYWAHRDFTLIALFRPVASLSLPPL